MFADIVLTMVMVVFGDCHPVSQSSSTCPAMLRGCLLSLSLLVGALALFGDDEIYSKFWQYNDLAGKSGRLTFPVPCMIYIASTNDVEASTMENRIQLFSPHQAPISLARATMPDEQGFLKPVYDEGVTEINYDSFNYYNYPNSAILYVVEATASSKVMLSQHEPVKLVMNGTTVSEELVTILCPFRSVKLSKFDSSGISFMTLTAGGANETHYATHKLHELNSLSQNLSQYIFEPVVTVRKTASLKGSFEMIVQTPKIDIRKPVHVRVDWADSVIAMSSGFRFPAFNPGSISYHIVAAKNNTKYDVKISGDIAKGSSLTFIHSGYDGQGIEGWSDREGLFEEKITIHGHNLTIVYKRDANDFSDGFMAIVDVSKLSQQLVTYVLPFFIIMLLL